MLPYIARLPKHAALRDQLLAEKLVTEQQVLQCRDLFADEKIVPETTLFRLRQAFPVFRFLRCRPAHYGYRGSSVPLRSCRRLSFRRRSRKISWSGAAISLIAVPHSSSTYIHRCRSSAFVSMKPRVGKLLAYTRREGFPPVLWAYDIDSDTPPTGAALCALYIILRSKQGCERRPITNV